MKPARKLGGGPWVLSSGGRSTMTRRPIIRWKSFWLGVLPLGFLGWAWVAFEDDPVAMIHCRQKVSHVISCGGGRVTFMKWTSFDRYENSPADGIQAGKGLIVAEPEPPRFAKAWQWRHHGSVDWTLEIAHWVVMLAFLVAWASLLGWRWRRMKRLAAGSVEPAAGSSI